MNKLLRREQDLGCSAAKQQLFIIRFSNPVLFKSGVRSNICSRTGTREEVEMYAGKLARENNVTVEAIC